mmetsp:Transcript_84280/g.239463  ORF Transcript_84280/g.239463 Transcript_84280/m.239463 type:complete len:205 (-) Transcript_84280:615-1229(-)
MIHVSPSSESSTGSARVKYTNTSSVTAASLSSSAPPGVIPGTGSIGGLWGRNRTECHSVVRSTAATSRRTSAACCFSSNFSTTPCCCWTCSMANRFASRWTLRTCMTRAEPLFDSNLSRACLLFSTRSRCLSFSAIFSSNSHRHSRSSALCISYGVCGSSPPHTSLNFSSCVSLISISACRAALILATSSRMKSKFPSPPNSRW